MRKLKVLVFAIVFLFLTLTSACGNNIPLLKFSSDKEFMIGCLYGGVPGGLNIYDENNNLIESNVAIPDDQYMQYYRELKEAGFTMVSGGYHNMDYRAYLRGLKACEELGLKMLVYDYNLVQLLMDDKKSDQEVVDRAKEYYSEYFNSPAFAGISVWDEPSYDLIPSFTKAKTRWDMICPGKLFYINLLPVIAHKSLITDNYQDYIRQFTTHIDDSYFSYDHYVLLKGSRGNYLAKTFIYNLTLAKTAAPNSRAWTVLQSIEHGTYRALESAADAKFQVYTALACGYEGFSWFCFWPPVPFDGACHFGDGAYSRQTNQKTPTYTYVQQANNEIKQLEDVYFNFDWQGIKTIIGTDNDNGGENDDFAMSAFAETNTERIKDIKTKQDTLIGVFKSKDGMDGYMFVNYTEPSAGYKNVIEVQFENCSKVAIFERGVQRIVKTKDGKITLNQDSGEGTFVIPIK